jgi:hypothetical protein
MGEGLAKFRIDASPLGRGAVEVNGEDVSERLSGLRFEMRAGQPPLLTLVHTAAHGVIEGEGIVQVQSDTGRDSIIRFLSHIDPTILEAEVLNRLGMGDEGTMRMALQVLLEWVGEEG